MRAAEAVSLESNLRNPVVRLTQTASMFAWDPVKLEASEFQSSCKAWQAEASVLARPEFSIHNAGSRMRIREIVKRAIFSLVPLSLLTASGVAWAASDVPEIVRQSIGRLGLQVDMPVEIARPQGWFDWLKFDLSPDTIRIMLWGAVILGILVTIWSLRDSLPIFSRSRRIVAREALPASSSPSSRMEDAQIEADDLARQGHYGEAMHVLLLKSLAEIRTRLGVSFAASLTSREIVRRVQLPLTGRGALAAIVQSVERTYYGGRPASHEDYSGCREEFDMLKRSLAVVPA